jgi:hypothetical protein
MKRILLIANKNWEAAPILNALLNPLIRSSSLGDPSIINYPWNYPQGSIAPRAVWSSFPGMQFELWCIQDIMEPKWNTSSSQGKVIDMPKIINFAPDPPSMVVALGTAASGSKTVNHNGCVVMGSNVFIHNYHPNGSNPDSVLDEPANFEKLITSSITEEFFEIVNAHLKNQVAQNLLKPFLHPAETIQLIAKKEYVALSTVNVTNYKEYPQSDPAGMAAFENAGTKMPVGSVESTHGLIRLLIPGCPFIFVSGIANRFTLIGTDVNGTDNHENVKTNAVNYSAAFNIGVAMGCIIPEISKYLNL